MKMRYGFLILFICFEIFFDFFLVENYVLELDNQNPDSKIRIHSQYFENWYRTRKNLISYRIGTTPYSIVFHIEADRLTAVRQLKVDSGDNTLFDLSTTELVEWNGSKNLDTGIGHAEFKFEELYTDPSKNIINLYFTKIDVTNEKPLRITFKYLDANRKLVIEEVKTKVIKIKDWDHTLTSIKA